MRRIEPIIASAAGLVVTAAVVWLCVGGPADAVVALAVVPVALLALLLGHRAGLRRAEQERRRRQLAAIELGDSIVQGLSAAKWSLESGDVRRGLDIIGETLRVGNESLADLVRDADVASAWTGRR